MCTDTCSNDGFKQNYTKLCVRTCADSNQDDVAEYGDPYDSKRCVETCPANTFADNQTNR